MTVLPHSDSGPPTLYLGLSGVVYPSESNYRLVYGRSPWDDGHAKFQDVSVLVRALAPWPELRIVLTSTYPWRYGLPATLEALGPALASRVDGFTFEDITTRVTREVSMRSGGTRILGYSSNEYWRMSKADIVAVHSAWRRPVAWIAIDDEDILWPIAVRQDRVVLTDPCIGLDEPDTLDRLWTVLELNVGCASGTQRCP